MNLAEWPNAIAYLAVFLATAVEGEVVFVSACILASLGRLDPFALFVAAALGGSAGDQFFFYALRGRLRGWLSRFPRLLPRQEQIALRVSRHSTGIILACRFLPGLRIAIPAACAYAGVSPVRFTFLSLAGSLAWSGAIVLLVTRESTAALTGIGLGAMSSPIVAGILILGFFVWLGRRSRTLLGEPGKESKLTG